ncbi:hypothetical protein V866_003670 [Kwoniella sp. B9012]
MLHDHLRQSRSSTSCSSSFTSRTETGDDPARPRQALAQITTSHSHNKTVGCSPRPRSGFIIFYSQHLKKARKGRQTRFRAHTQTCTSCIVPTTDQLKEWGLVEGVVRADEKKAMYHRVYKNVEEEQKKKFEKDLKEGKVWYRSIFLPHYCEGYPCRGDIRYCQEWQKLFYTRNCVKHHGLSAQYIGKPGVKIDVKFDRPNPKVDIISNAEAREDVHADRNIKVLESEIRREKQISARLLDEVEGGL